jgi:tetratricopeptide (TPR) repeat protein
MNRAENRRNKKLANKGAKTTKSMQASALIAAEQEKRLTVNQAIQVAVQLHTTGDLPKAKSIYEQILQTDQNHPVALHLLGVIAHQVGKHEIAVDLITKALVIKPDYAEAYYDLGLTLQDNRKLNEALINYNKALTIKPDYAEAHSNLGNVLKDLGEFDAAVESFNKALAIKPDYALAHSNLGNTLKNLGKFDEAVVSYNKALDIKPDYADAYSNLGNALKYLGKFDEAVESFNKAIVIKPDYAEAHSNLGNVLKDLGRFDEALVSYNNAIVIKPDYVEAHSNLGNVLQELGQLDEALSCYNKALNIKPNFAEAHSNLGLALQELGQLDEALVHFDKAIAIKPDYVEAYNNSALALIASGHPRDALHQLKKKLELVRGDCPIDPHQRSFRLIKKTKMEHDIEQFDYLAASGHEVEKFKTLAALYKEVSSEINWPTNDDTLIPLSNCHLQLIGDTYNRPIYVPETPEVAKSTLSNTLDVEKITANYFKHDFGMTYFDSFLSPDALDSLRYFLLSSTVWFDFFHTGGYLGAYLDDGLCCPLLLQIASDLRKTFPKIFKNHPLNYLWAYKYNSQLTGINKHADFAAINVNFWITPKTANLNSTSGGLIVYNTEAPLSWNFETYNRDEEKIIKHLEYNNGGKTVVPYNENRIVLFNSNLIHETDKFEFKEGYENRRINVTMLFGKRGA